MHWTVSEPGPTITWIMEWNQHIPDIAHIEKNINIFSNVQMYRAYSWSLLKCYVIILCEVPISTSRRQSSTGVWISSCAMPKGCSVYLHTLHLYTWAHIFSYDTNQEQNEVQNYWQSPLWRAVNLHSSTFTPDVTAILQSSPRLSITVLIWSDTYYWVKCNGDEIISLQIQM